MTYAEFVAHVTTFAWRDNDVSVAASIDNLIRMANEQLREDIDFATGQTEFVTSTSTNDVPLPSGYNSMEAVSSSETGVMRFLPLSQMTSLQEETNSTLYKPFYTLLGSTTLRLCGPWDGSETLTIVYQRDVPDFATDDTSWVADDFLSLYTYCVLQHICTFIQDMNNLTMYGGMYAALLEKTKERHEFTKKRAVSAAMALPRQAGITR